MVRGILASRGCPAETCDCVAAHLVAADLAGVASHGIFRVLEYAERLANGDFAPGARAELTLNDAGAVIVDGRGGIGIPAMELATDHVIETATTQGIAAVAICDAGHTGRLGAFTERAAKAGLLCIVIGGGNRARWPQVAPHGGREGRLPTNPISIAIPGGPDGPVVLDFATAAAAGGWIYRARASGTDLPPGLLIDPKGQPTTDPADYFRGGALLPAAGPKGYAMALVAEIIGEAMLGPARTECNWLMIGIDTTRYREAGALRDTAEEILADIRSCPPAAGCHAVEIPGERERAAARQARKTGLTIPRPIWRAITALHAAQTPPAERSLP